MWRLLITVVLLTSCGEGDGGFTEESACEGREPLSFDEVKASSDDGEIVLDLLCYPETPWRAFVDAVNDDLAEAEMGLIGTDRSLIQYGVASCGGPQPPLPEEWEPVPGIDTPGDVRRYAALARERAAEFLCSLV